MHKPHSKTKDAKTGAQQHLKNLEPPLPPSTAASIPVQQLHMPVIKLNKQSEYPITIHIEAKDKNKFYI